MRSTRIYLPNPDIGAPYQIDSKAAHHLINVLRFSTGDRFVAFDGEGSEFTAQITKIEKKAAWTILNPKATINCESNLAIHLAQALTKSDKMDYIIQKSIELGVTKITPLITERTEMKLDATRQVKKHQHWQQIIISACEQSGRSWLPTLDPITNFRSFVAQSSSLTIMLHPKDSTPLSQLAFDTSAITLLIGPEGGFSDTEIEIAKHHNTHCVSLGPRILRTETAGLAAIASLQTLWGDFNG